MKKDLRNKINNDCQENNYFIFPASTVTSTFSKPPSLGTTATSCIITPSSQTSPNTITSTVLGGKIKYFT